jgi:hypothetical protein
MLPSLIELRDLTKICQQGDLEVLALNRITLEIGAGGCRLMGPSGSAVDFPSISPLLGNAAFKLTITGPRELFPSDSTL